MFALETLDERKDGVDGALVGSEQDAPFLDIAQLGNRARSLVGQPEETMGVVEQQVACVGQGAVPGRSVDQSLSGSFLQTANRLADRRLRPSELLRSL